MSKRFEKRALNRAVIVAFMAFWASFGFALLTGKQRAIGSTVAAFAQSSEDDGAAASFVYTITNPNGPNAIAAYRRDLQTGELALIGTFETGGRGTGGMVDSQSPLIANPDGTRLYAVNTGSNDISVMAIREDGSLELIGTPVPSGGIEPASLALFEDLLYVANIGDDTTPPNYTGFRLIEDDQLAPIKKSTKQLNIGDDPGHVLFNRDGSVLIGTRIRGRMIDSFTIRRKAKKYGRLRRVAELSDQPGPFGAAFNPAADDQLIVSSVRLPGAASYRVFSDGAVLPINSVPNSPERAACWITVHSNGRFAWVANTGSHSLSLYTIDRDGAVTLAGTHSTAAFGRLPFEVALDRGGQFLHVLHVSASNPNIHVMRVADDVASAALEDVAAFTLPAGSTPMGLVVVDRN